MAKLSKRARAIAEQVNTGKLYPIEEAVGLLSQLCRGKSRRVSTFP